MRPISRGTGLVEFTIRVQCEIGMQFTFSGGGTSLPFQLDGISCNASISNGSLILEAHGLPSTKSAKSFFLTLQKCLALLSLQQRIPITIPSVIREPEKAIWSFIPGSTDCVAHGWPSIAITPLLIDSREAWLYPEHEYVAIAETFRLAPNFEHSLWSFVDGFGQLPEMPTDSPASDILLLAVSDYTTAIRSTQWVWSFLLAVMTLEMLAEFRPASPETRDAIDELKKEAALRFSKNHAVDLERIKNCLGNAKQASKGTAVRELVWKYCRPGTATSPAATLFADAADCKAKVVAMYGVRSLYVHEGRVKSPSDVAFSFSQLHQFALESLGHVLMCLLNEKSSTDAATH